MNFAHCLFLCVLLVGCHPSVDLAPLPSSEDVVYFPLFPRAIVPPGAPWYAKFMDPNLDEVDISWFSSELTVLEEPSLYEGSTASERHAYRFLWLRSFNPAISVRLEILDDQSGILIVKEGTAHGFKRGLARVSTRKIGRYAVFMFLASMDSLKFWKMPSREGPKVSPDGKSISIIGHGSAWVLEGARDGKFHVVYRHSPKSGPFRDTAWWFIRKSGLRLWPEDIY
jgi:hypothetical protein